MSCYIRLVGVSKIYRITADRQTIGLWQALRNGAPEITTTDVIALHPLDLNIENGERVGIIGHNGAGKTTLLQIIAGLASPSAGSIDVRGKVSAIMTMGMAQRNEATGRENIYLDGELQGRTREQVDAMVDEIIEFTELGEFIYLPVRTYSSGMQARLAFALAVSVVPEILIIDEVLSVGDAYFNAKAKKRMDRLTSDGQIVLVVSHGMGSVRDMCTRCLWFDHGRLVMDGKPDEVTSAYEKAVAIADERELAKRFAKRLVAPTNTAAVATLDRIRITSPTGSEVGASIESERDYDILVSGHLTVPADHTELTVAIERLDGIQYGVLRLDRAAGLPRSGPFAARYGLRPLVLGSGVYRMEAILSVADRLVSRAECAFEVTTRRVLIGGAPLLYYPCSVTVLDQMETTIA